MVQAFRHPFPAFPPSGPPWSRLAFRHPFPAFPPWVQTEGVLTVEMFLCLRIILLDSHYSVDRQRYSYYFSYYIPVSRKANIHLAPSAVKSVCVPSHPIRLPAKRWVQISQGELLIKACKTYKNMQINLHKFIIL